MLRRIGYAPAMKALEIDSRFALLGIPFLIGAMAVWMAIAGVHTGNPSDLEGALFMTAIVGWGVSLLLPPLVVAISAWALRESRVPLPLFLMLLLVALAPVAYFQCANMQSSLLLAWLSNGMNFPQYEQAFPRLLTEALAIFGGFTALVGYGLYRLVPRAAPE